MFSSGGSIEVQNNIRLLDSGQTGGFVFKAGSNATASNPTTYKITSKNGQLYGFDGAGLDIEENVKVEWGLGFIKGNGSGDKREVNDALHKVGKGTLVIITKYDTPPDDGKYGYLRVAMARWSLVPSRKPLMACISQVGAGLWSW